MLRSAASYRPVKANSVLLPAPDIQVLLATFNGQTHLDEQLASVFAQDWPCFSILVSDDGSSDHTLAILERWQRNAGKLNLLPSHSRVGPMRNFARLMQASTANYVAFCDQDDLWDKDKLSLSMACMLDVESIHPSGTPILVYSDLRLIDESGTLLSASLWQKARVRPANAGFSNMLAQNLVTGCSMLANRALLDIALPLPDAAIMHDYWLALTASAFGTASPLLDPTLSYRQHASNAVGAGKSLKFSQRARRLFVDAELSAWLPAAATQAEAFLEQFGNLLTDHQKSALKVMAEIHTHSVMGCLVSLIRNGIVRTEPMNQLQFLLRLAFGNVLPNGKL